MLEQFQLAQYDTCIKDKINNTGAFIKSIQNITL
ncbi:hypothetical protein SAMN05444671_4290 [Flavobacterium sp. CF108]|nr:hypothetical protein SAMN05444671_4290 [Flavobacterium sp. CF108]